jgi:hypothetical protein
MKTATIPSIPVEPAFREQMERVLNENESLSQFVETAVRNCVRQRMDEAEFLARGLRSLAKAKESSEYIEADEAVARLRKTLDRAIHANRLRDTLARTAEAAAQAGLTEQELDRLLADES